MLNDRPWEAFKKMCKAYEKVWTFYAKSSQRDEQKKTKPRKKMLTRWMKPLQATTDDDFEFLCSAAPVGRPREKQHLYFEEHSKNIQDAIPNTLYSIAHVAKQRVGIQNALQWLHISVNEGVGKVGWLTQDVTQYGEREVLNALTKEGSKELYKNWSFVPFNTGYDTMQALKHMILLALKSYL